MRAWILIVEEDAAVSGLLSANLNMFGYQTVCAENGRQARKALQARRFDLALCDLTLPERDGAVLLSALKAQGLPVIYVSDSADAPRDVIKPANIRELMARMEAILRRREDPPLTLSYRDITVNEESRSVTRDGAEVALKPMEYDLLVSFLRQPGKTMTREELLQQVWGDASIVATRTVDVHVAALRRKLGLTRALATVYRIGYRLENE